MSKKNRDRIIAGNYCCTGFPRCLTDGLNPKPIKFYTASEYVSHMMEQHLDSYTIARLVECCKNDTTEQKIKSGMKPTPLNPNRGKNFSELRSVDDDDDEADDDEDKDSNVDNENKVSSKKTMKKVAKVVEKKGLKDYDEKDEVDLLTLEKLLNKEHRKEVLRNTPSYMHQFVKFY
ncbi:MAG: hypothetical protein EOO43_00620 [Flavobacterium sp.]|nr:MAG: hypothetical protein EOO43_00620 [Flavobacterium sp.]